VPCSRLGAHSRHRNQCKVGQRKNVRALSISSGLGLLFLSKFEASSTAFFFSGRLSLLCGRLARACTSDTSRFSVLKWLLRNQCMASFISFSAFFGVILPGGGGNPASLLKAYNVGSFNSYGFELLFRSQFNALSATCFFSWGGMLDFGIGSPAMLAKACNVGSSTSSDRGLLFRSQLRASSAAFFFVPGGKRPEGTGSLARLESA
jgi:hypothetical protein